MSLIQRTTKEQIYQILKCFALTELRTSMSAQLHKQCNLFMLYISFYLEIPINQTVQTLEVEKKKDTFGQLVCTDPRLCGNSTVQQMSKFRGNVLSCSSPCSALSHRLIVMMFQTVFDHVEAYQISNPGIRMVIKQGDMSYYVPFSFAAYIQPIQLIQPLTLTLTMAKPRSMVAWISTAWV